LNAGYSSAYVTLTGNVSSITVPAGSFGGQSFHVTTCQGSGGPYTVPAIWSNVTGTTTIWATGCTRFHLVWDDPASTWVSTIQGPANSVSAPLAISGNNISIPAASSTTSGYLAAADWTTFNNKQSATAANANNAGIGSCASGQFATGTAAGATQPCAQVAASQVSGLAVSATTDTTNASNLTAGTVPPGRLPVFGASGSSHAIGAVPDPGSTAGSTRYLREDGTWVAPSASGGVNSATAYSAPYYVSGGAAISGVSGTGVPVHSTSAAPTFLTVGGSGTSVATVTSGSLTAGHLVSLTGTGGQIADAGAALGGGGSVVPTVTLGGTANHVYVSSGTTGLFADSGVNIAGVLYGSVNGQTYSGANTFSANNTFSVYQNFAATRYGRATVSNAAYTVSSANYEVAYTSLSAAQTVTLTAASSIGTSAYPQYFVIKDETGNAGTYNITVSVSGGGTIDGASSKVINAAYGELRVYSNGTAYFTW
jgi:hypothetical protein